MPRPAALALALACAALACTRAALDTSPSAPEAASPPADAASALLGAASPPPGAADPPRAPLAPEVAARLEMARGQLSSTAAATVLSGVFVVVAERPGAFFDDAVALARRALAALLHGRFATLPSRPVTVYVFPGAQPYEAFCLKRFRGTPTARNCHASQAYGFYHPETRELLANLGPGSRTLTHEIVHPLVEADFPAAPAWLGECLGTLYESAVFPRAGEIHGAVNWRLPLLQASLASPAHHAAARMDALFAQSDDAFRADAGPDLDVHYAAARYTCQWLDDTSALWPFYRAWRDGAASDPHGDLAFRAAVGETPGEAEATWESWARALVLP